MRILQVCSKYYPSIGGLESHVSNVSERLARQHQVTVFTGDASGKLPREEEIKTEGCFTLKLTKTFLEKEKGLNE